MGTVPPPAVAPPPLSVSKQKSKTSPAKLLGIDPNDLIWRNDEQEREEILEGLGHLSLDAVCTEWARIPVASAVQGGPTCGMHALSMALTASASDSGSAANLNPDWRPLAIEHAALQRGWTEQGEIMSVDIMADLARAIGAESLFSLEACPLASMRASLRLGHDLMLLVPYDSDGRGAPGLHGGKHAHWALLIGRANGDAVLARHSRSPRIHVWKWSQLLESNSQLEICARSDGRVWKLDALRGLALCLTLNGTAQKVRI